MLQVQLKNIDNLNYILTRKQVDFPILAESLEEKVRLLIVRDLLRLGWEMNIKADKILIKPPCTYNKQVVKDAMQIKRKESISKNYDWINKHNYLIKENIANGSTAWESTIEPIIEVCENRKQFDVFRMFRFYWSSSYSEYVGRRIKLLIRDSAIPNKPLIGIAAIGSSIIHIPERDKYIGWDINKRTKNLIYTMDAYVLGALPPYNELLGGKLISYIIASNEVRDIFKRKYKGKVTNISKRTANRLACIFTTSLYGKSSQYNRLKYNDNLLYIPIGHTKGYGTLHLSYETFTAMRDLIASHNVIVSNIFGNGPIWSMRVIRTAANILGFDADFLLRHSFQREIYVIPLASNYKAFLKGENVNLRSCDYPLNKLANHWKDRWLKTRKMNQDIKERVLKFRADDFKIV